MARKNLAKIRDREQFKSNCIYIGKMLRSFRESKNMTQAEIASKLEVGTNYPSLLETGKEPVPLARVFEICKAYEMGEDADGFALVILSALYADVLRIGIEAHSITLKQGKAAHDIAWETVYSLVKSGRIELTEEEKEKILKTL